MLAENRRQLIVGLLGATVLIIAALVCVWIYQSLTKGTISLSTNNDEAGLQIKSGGSVVAEGKHRLSVRVKPGSYVVTASTSTASTSRTVAIKARQKQSVELPLSNPVAPVPVYGGGARDVAAGGVRLIFINTDSRLSQINAQNQVQVLDATRVLRSARWVSSDAGAAQDDKGNFYYVTAGALVPVAAPFAAGSRSASYAIDGDRNLYLSNGQDVYKGSAGGAFTKIYSSGARYNIGLAAGSGNLAIIEKDSDGTTSIAVVTASGKTVKKTVDAGSLSWSPGGRHLAVAGGGSVTIFDQTLGKVSGIAQRDAGNIIWQDDDTVLFSAGNQLLSYNAQEERSSQLSNVPGNGRVLGVSLSDDKQYAYLVAQRRNSDTTTDQIFRVGLRGQADEAKLQALSVFLPTEVGVCSIDYVNFAKLTITIRYPSSGTDPALCVRAAQGELRYYDLDVPTGDFTTTPYTVVY